MKTQKTLAITDGMTGLYNHRYFLERINEEFERTRRYKRSLSLIMIDVDHFKKYNDILKKYKLEHFRARLKQIIINFKDIKYLDLNPRQFKLKKEELKSSAN